MKLEKLFEVAGVSHLPGAQRMIAQGESPRYNMLHGSVETGEMEVGVLSPVEIKQLTNSKRIGNVSRPGDDDQTYEVVPVDFNTGYNKFVEFLIMSDDDANDFAELGIFADAVKKAGKTRFVFVGDTANGECYLIAL